MDFVRQNAASIADRFLQARRSAAGLSGFPGELPATLDEAYAIQDAAIAAWGKPILGWKVGRVQPPLSERFGTDRLAGPIFSCTTGGADGAAPDMPVFAEGFAAAEAEYLLQIAAPPPADKTSFTLDECAELIGSVHVGIEIASSPLVSINDIGPVAVISDFGNNNGLVVGDAIPDWRSSGFEQWPVSTFIDGENVGTGRAESFPAGALGSVRFLFELLARRGIPIAAGQWISSGAVTGVHDVRAGQQVDVRFGEGLALACRTVPAHAD